MNIRRLLPGFLTVVLLCMAARAAEQTKGEVLFDQLRKAEDAQELQDKRKEQRLALEALLSADAATLQEALAACVADAHPHGRFVRMLMERCARSDSTATLAKVENSRSDRRELLGWVWGVIAQEDPDRALAMVQSLYDPRSTFYQGTLQMGHKFHSLVEQITVEIGKTWLRREGLGALKYLDSLSHAEDLDEPLFHGFCEAARNIDERLALLDWMITPVGRERVNSVRKASTLREDIFAMAAKDDLERTRSWLMKNFPPSTGSAAPSHEDATRFRQKLFEVWKPKEPLKAATWLMAQQRHDDPGIEDTLCLCAWALTWAPEPGLTATLNWLGKYQDITVGRYRDIPALASAAADVLNGVADKKFDDGELQQVANWIGTLPLLLREKILFQTRMRTSAHLAFTLLESDTVLQRVCPEAKEMTALIQRLRRKFLEYPALLPLEEKDTKRSEPSCVGNEFPLPARKLQRIATAESLAKARQLAQWNADASTSSDPARCLQGLSALDWLTSAKPQELRAILQADLENTNGEVDEFAVAIVDQWARHWWQECERFAWDAVMPASTRRALLLETFMETAKVSPDALLGRLEMLIAENKMWARTLDYDPPGQRGPGLFWSATLIPVEIGASWIVKDGARALEKIQHLPASWVPGTLGGASNAFEKADAGLALLDWIARQDATDPPMARDDNRCCGLGWERWLQARPILSRLSSLDIEAARRWIEAKPERRAET